MIENGIISGLTSEDYHSDLAVGASGLKRLAISPAHYWAAFLDPEREPVDKVAFRIGRAWHCAVFEPHAFAERFAVNHDVHPSTRRAVLLKECLADGAWREHLAGVPDDIKLTTKEGKALAAEIEARGQLAVAASDLAFIDEWLPRLGGRDVLSSDHIDRVLRMSAIARRLPISRVVFEQMAEYGAAEQSLFSTDPVTGVRIKIRPDYALAPCPSFPSGLIIDGKSTTDASEEGFGRQVWNLDYGLQAAFYTRVFQQVWRTPERPPFMWLAQEKESPYAARYYGAGDDLLVYWDRRIDGLLQLFAACQRSGEWPAYPETVKTLALPAWAQKQVDEVHA